MVAQHREQRARLRDALRAERAALREGCSVRVREARAETDEAIAQLARTEKGRRAALTSAQLDAMRRNAKRAREKAAESDDEVLRNIEHEVDLADAWRQMPRARRAKFRDDRYATRTERFLDWAHNHPPDVAALADRWRERRVYREPETEEEWLEALGRAPKSARGGAILDDEDIPF